MQSTPPRALHALTPATRLAAYVAEAVAKAPRLDRAQADKLATLWQATGRDVEHQAAA